ncbi:MAG TPA: hypothetical protein PLZ43_13900 [bacterium]|nr:hypothetical protein [bacterium]
MDLSKTFECPACGKENIIYFYEPSMNICECKHCHSYLDIEGEKARHFGFLYGIIVVLTIVASNLIERIIYPWFVVNRPDLLVTHKKLTIDLISSATAAYVGIFFLLLISLFEFNNATKVKTFAKKLGLKKRKVIVLALIFVFILFLATITPIYFLIF